MGDSQKSGITDGDADDGSGYADQFHEEIGLDGDYDDIDQLNELTVQIKKECQEEMEEELEKQIEAKYKLKLLKHETELKVKVQEIEILKSENKKKMRQLKILEQGGGLANIHGHGHKQPVRLSQNIDIGGIPQPLSQVSTEDMKINENDAEQQMEDPQDHLRMIVNRMILRMMSREVMIAGWVEIRTKMLILRIRCRCWILLRIMMIEVEIQEI